MIRVELIVRAFEELTVDELYDLLKLRCDVFVVEQACAYADIDGVDRTAVHLMLRDGEGLAACLRVFADGRDPAVAHIGRVVSARRRLGLGTRLLREGLRVARERFGAEAVELEAQTWARSFYERQGFVPVSEPFDEDGIEHIRMRLNLKLREADA